jgi:shikimate dehydrogenase
MKHIHIDGATRLYAIVGDPIVQARSPAVYSELFAQRGLPAVMVPVHIPVAKIGQAGRLFEDIANLDGLLVTSPFKSHFAQLASSLGPAAECVGAVNALRRRPDGGWHGDMFDGQGFVRGARSRGIELRDRQVHLFGAGGAGSAIAYELAMAGVRSIQVTDPNQDKAKSLCAAIAQRVPDCQMSPEYRPGQGLDFIVNASTTGFGGSPGLPGPIPILGPDIAVGEVNVTDKGTALVQAAQAAGSQWLDGAHMHAGQIDCLMEFFFEQD